MHIEKNVCMNIVGTLLDIPRKSKDGMNTRLDLSGDEYYTRIGINGYK